MIHKIERIASIGKFRDYSATGQVNFQKLTTIFGDNGSGKTTLTSIFRSMSVNEPDIISKRVSTNHTIQQAAQIITRAKPNPDTHHTYNPNTGWSNIYPNIEILDIHFVNENIHSGFEFTDDHKKQLHQFVIGAQGVAILQQMEQNKIDKATSKQIQNGIEQQLIQQVGNNLSSALITSFLSLQQQDAINIADRITHAETALTNARANSVIQTLQILNEISEFQIDIDIETLKIDLQTSMETIQDLVLRKLFEDHCVELSENTFESPEKWLREGFNYFKEKQKSDDQISISCPFCQQEINDTVDIIKAYTLQFNEEFNSLLERIQIHMNNLESINITTKTQAIVTQCNLNAERINSWSQHLANTVQAPNTTVIQDENHIKTQFDSLLSLVSTKLQNPSEAVEIESVENFEATVQSIEENRTNYNQNIVEYNTEITALRANIQSVEHAQSEVERLRRIENRFLPTIFALCNQLITERQRLRTLETAYTQLSQQQQVAATTFFTIYRDQVNTYLDTVFHTDFRIDEVVNVPPQGRATQSKIDYKLTIDGVDISFDPNQPFCIKDCLSEGDKSTLALAFFLAKLNVDPNIQNKVIVFDDPISSLDTNRRTYTLGVLRTIYQNIRQLIVLSHNAYFLYELIKDIPQADKKSLRITEDFTNGSSNLEVCDLDELVQNDYFKHLDALDNFRRNPDHNMKDTVLGWLRNVLESHLRFKFHRDIRLMGGQKTFGRLITFLDNQGVIFRDNANRANIISTLNLINSVSWMPHHGTPAPNFTTLGINPNTLTAPELDRLIQDTLNLIDNQI